MDPIGLTLEGGTARIELEAGRRVPLLDGAGRGRIEEALDCIEGGTARLSLLIGQPASAVLSGSAQIQATAALELGLLAAVTSAADLDREAQSLAKRIAGAPPRRVALVKEALSRLRGPTARRRLEGRLALLELSVI